MFADRRAAAFVHVGEWDGLFAGTVQNDGADFLGQLFERRVDVEFVEGREALQHLEVELVAPVPALDRAGRERQRRVGDHALGVEEGDLAETVAFRAGAHRVVEGKQARLEFLQRIRADRAGEFGAEQLFLAAVHLERDSTSVREAHRGFERFGQTLLEVRAHFHAIDHDVYRMFVVLFQLGQIFDLVDLRFTLVGGTAARTDAKAHEALGLHCLEQFRVFALAVCDHRGQHHQFCVLGQGQYRIDHLRYAFRFERQMVVRAVRRADAGV